MFGILSAYNRLLVTVLSSGTEIRLDAVVARSDGECVSIPLDIILRRTLPPVDDVGFLLDA